MVTKFIGHTGVLLALALSVSAQEQAAQPDELKVLESFVGVWDATIEVWPNGKESPSMEFSGVETIRAYGKHWLSSDFDSEFGGQKIGVHSIIGYDLDQKKLVGMIIDQGPYAATMSGEYDSATTSINWTTKAKEPNGKPMVQHTRMSVASDGKRTLELSVPEGAEGEFKKFMQIEFVKRTGKESE